MGDKVFTKVSDTEGQLVDSTPKIIPLDADQLTVDILNLQRKLAIITNQFAVAQKQIQADIDDKQTNLDGLAAVGVQPTSAVAVNPVPLPPDPVVVSS